MELIRRWKRLWLRGNPRHRWLAHLASHERLSSNFSFQKGNNGMEPIAVRPHDALAYRPELNGKQAIIDCRNGYGLSVIWANGSRFGDEHSLGHGFYAGEGTAEVLLIRFNNPNPIDAPDDFEFVNLDGSPRTEMFDLRPFHQPIGWLSWEQIGELAERIAQEGVEGYRR